MGTLIQQPAQPMELQSIGSQQEIECPICLQSLNDDGGGQLVVEVGCQGKHRYHETCFRSWVAASSRSSMVTTCPSCRDPVYEVRLLMHDNDDEILHVVPTCRQGVYVMISVAQIAWIFLMLYSMVDAAPT